MQNNDKHMWMTNWRSFNDWIFANIHGKYRLTNSHRYSCILQYIYGESELVWVTNNSPDFAVDSLLVSFFTCIIYRQHKLMYMAMAKSMLFFMISRFSKIHSMKIDGPRGKSEYMVWVKTTTRTIALIWSGKSEKM